MAEGKFYYRYGFACKECVNGEEKGNWHFGGSYTSFEEAEKDAHGGSTSTCPKKHSLPKKPRPIDIEYGFSIMKCPHCGKQHPRSPFFSIKSTALDHLDFNLKQCAKKSQKRRK